jgi:hypothetical protein
MGAFRSDSRCFLSETLLWGFLLELLFIKPGLPGRCLFVGEQEMCAIAVAPMLDNGKRYNGRLTKRL